MIKKIVIENYGSFKKIATELGDVFPTFVVGLNDVGKTAFLNAIWALKNGVVDKYMDENDDKKRMKIQITLSIIKEFYDEWKEKDDFIKSFGDLYVGNLTINVDNIIGKKTKIPFEDLKNGDVSIFIENNVLKKIKSFIKKPQVKHLDIDKLSDDNIEEIYNWFPQKKEEEGHKLLSLFKKFKNFLFNLTSKIHFLKLNDTKEWDFIKDKYSLREIDDYQIRDKIGKKETILDIVKVFAPKFYEDFNNIISNDSSGPKSIEQKVAPIVNAIDKSFNDFLENYFPATNRIISEFRSKNINNMLLIEWWMRDECEKIEKEKYLPVNNRSEGFKWFLKLYYTIEKSKPYDVIIVDEPEKFLHINTQKEFIEFVKNFVESKKIQFIFATHSPWIISDKKGLNILRTKNIRFLQKENGETKIFTFDQILNSPENKGINDLISIINTALGFNYLEFMQLNKNKKIVFVEGYADVLLWRFACEILKKKDNDYDKFRFWPLYNDTKFYNVGLAEALNLEYKVLLDRNRQIWEKNNPKIEIDPKKLVFLGDELKEQNIINPEDILSEQKKKKFGFDLKTNTHFLSWNKIYNDYKMNEKEFFDQDEIQRFKYYFSVVNKIFEKNTAKKTLSIINTTNKTTNNNNLIENKKLDYN